MSKSIKLKNNHFWDTSAIMHKRKNLQTILDSKDNKSIVQMWPSTTNYINYEYGNINWDQYEVIGTKLRYTNGVIQVMDPTVKHVKISIRIFLEDFGGDLTHYIWAFVALNGTNLYNTIFSGVRVYFQTLIIDEYIFDVNVGDWFSLTLNNPNYRDHAPTVRGGRYNTRYTVEAID